MNSVQKLLSVSVIALLTACGGGGGGSDDKDDPEDIPAASSSAVPALPAAEPIEPVTIRIYWETPTSRKNGDPLLAGELAGFEILYINNLDDSDPDCCSIYVDDPLQTRQSIRIRKSGNYTFAIIAYDINGHFSDLSETVQATF